MPRPKLNHVQYFRRIPKEWVPLMDGHLTRLKSYSALINPAWETAPMTVVSGDLDLKEVKTVTFPDGLSMDYVGTPVCSHVWTGREGDYGRACVNCGLQWINPAAVPQK